MNEDLLRKPILLLDGGLGTTFEDQHSIRFSSTTTPLWSSHLLISSPKTVLDVQKAFAGAGADILLTATYQASFRGFSNTPRNPVDADSARDQQGYDRAEAENFMCKAVSIATSAFSAAGKRRGIVALSLGAYGATMVPSQEYTGNYPLNMQQSKGLYDFHLERLMTFKHAKTYGDIDIIAFETLPRLSEILAVRMVMKELQSITEDHKKFWISCVFPNDETKLPDGSSISEVIETMLSLLPPGADSSISQLPHPYAIGMNCTRVHRLRILISEFENAASSLQLALPHLVIYPDGADGLVYDPFAQQWIAEDEPLGDGSPTVTKAWDEEVFDIVREVQSKGAWKGILVGGCCKTNPAHIAKLRSRIDALNLEMKIDENQS